MSSSAVIYTEDSFFNGLGFLFDKMDGWNTFNLSIIDYSDDKTVKVLDEPISQR